MADWKLPGPAWLFCPADRPERFAKAAAAADVVILDLEDGVGADDRESARRALVDTPLDPARTVVRINPAGTPDQHLDLAALRETEEEIGLSRQHVTFAGYLDPHLVLSGFWVTPIVGFVQPGFALTLDRSEVDATFEVPLLHILDPTNHKARERTLGTTKVRVYDIPYGEHHIWGATAGMLIALYRLLNQ